MTPGEREHADRLSATAIQLASDLADALVWGEGARAETIREELSAVCQEVIPYLLQYQEERRAWRERRFPL